MPDTAHRYLKRIGRVWYLRFELPSRLGGRGQMVRQSLHTEDVAVAMGIRDRYVAPILAMDSVVGALQQVGRAIADAHRDAAAAMGQLDNIIRGAEGLTCEGARDKYVSWLAKSGLRPRTIEKYTAELTYSVGVLGGDRPVELLSRRDAAALRDGLRGAGKSPTTISCLFATVRQWLRWLAREGHISRRDLPLEFEVALPTVRKRNTAIIPPSMADAACDAVPGWRLPWILRYTGMRIGEAEACLVGHAGSGIVEVEGVRCFRVCADACKTHTERLVPVCAKLSAMLTDGFLRGCRAFCAPFGPNGRTDESPVQKAYNRAVKKLEGCAECHVHSWRVYAQTMMVEAGVDDGIVRRIIGHVGGRDVHHGYTAGRLEAMLRALDTIP